jgi:hypothetical protein
MSDNTSIASSLESCSTSEASSLESSSSSVSPDIHDIAWDLRLRTADVHGLKAAFSRGFHRKIAALSAVTQLTGEKLSNREQAGRLQRLDNLVLRGVPRANRQTGEGETKESLLCFVRDIIKCVTGLTVLYKVTDVVRLGEGEVVVVKFADYASRMQVAKRSRLFSMKNRNAISSSCGKMGNKPIYIDDDLTPPQQRRRKALWSLFRSLKQDGYKPSWRQHVLMYVPDPFSSAVPHPANTIFPKATSTDPSTSSPPAQGSAPAECGMLQLWQKHARSPSNTSDISSETMRTRPPRQKSRLYDDGCSSGSDMACSVG